jgi:CPA1 family monovalent cation:H+ antiporter
LDLSAPWAFVFGALISPSDPVAVLAAVRQGNLSKRLDAVLQGEALLNDGVGIVVFSAALTFATGSVHLNPGAALGEVAVQALGGLAKTPHQEPFLAGSSARPPSYWPFKPTTRNLAPRIA